MPATRGGQPVDLGMISMLSAIEEKAARAGQTAEVVRMTLVRLLGEDFQTVYREVAEEMSGWYSLIAELKRSDEEMVARVTRIRTWNDQHPSFPINRRTLPPTWFRLLLQHDRTQSVDEKRSFLEEMEFEKEEIERLMDGI